MTTGKKIALWTTLGLVLARGVFSYVRFFYVFSEGYQTGELNKFSYKGYVFKTYEGIMILTGFGNKSGTPDKPTVQSNYFEFSVADKDVADILSHSTGKRVEVHYKQYFGALPWRGFQKCIVDEVVNVSQEETLPADVLNEQSVL